MEGFPFSPLVFHRVIPAGTFLMIKKQLTDGLKCLGCGGHIDKRPPSRSGPQRKYCSFNCLHYDNCPDCGTRITRHSQRCRPCKEKLRRRASVRIYVCMGCSATFFRKPSSRQRGKYCSRKCAFAHAHDWNCRALEFPNAPAPYSQLYCGPCHFCNKPIIRKASIRFCDDECRDAIRASLYPRPVDCRQCGVEFSQMHGAHRFCGAACRRTSGRYKTRQIKQRARAKVRLKLADEYIKKNIVKSIHRLTGRTISYRSIPAEMITAERERLRVVRLLRERFK